MSRLATSSSPSTTSMAREHASQPTAVESENGNIGLVGSVLGKLAWVFPHCWLLGTGAAAVQGVWYAGQAEVLREGVALDEG